MLKAKRILASLIDWYILYFGIYGVILFIKYKILHYFPNYESYKFAVDFIYVIYFLFKDLIFKNASIGKRIAGLKIVTKDNFTPKFYIIILRNIFDPILFVADFLSIFIANIKLGDIVFKTKVIDCK